MKKINIKDYLGWIIVIICSIIALMNYKNIVSGIGFIINAFVPFIIGIIFAFILNRPYQYLRQYLHKKFKFKNNISKVLSIFIIYFLVFGLLVVIICNLIPMMLENVVYFSANFDSYMSHVQEIVNGIAKSQNVESVDLNSITTTVNKFINNILSYNEKSIPELLKGASSFLSTLGKVGIGIVFSIYILYDQEKLIRQSSHALKVYLPKKYYDIFRSWLFIIIDVFNDYIYGQVLDAFILGLLCFIGLFILRVNYSSMIGIIIGISALVPFIGAYVGGGISTLLLLLSDPIQAVIFLVYIFLLQQFEGNVIYPRIVGHKIGLPAIWVLLGITIGGELFGIVGMLIGVPVTTIIYNVIKDDVRRKSTIE